MKSYPSTELRQKLGDVLAAADHGPGAITRHRKTRYVLMDVATFGHLSTATPRRAFGVDEMPPEHLALLEEAVASLDAGDDDGA